MDQFKTYILVIRLESVPERGTKRCQNHLVFSDPLIILTDKGHIADLLQVLHIFSFIFILNFSISWSPFTDLTTKHFTGKQELWIFFSNSTNNLVFSINPKNKLIPKLKPFSPYRSFAGDSQTLYRLPLSIKHLQHETHIY